MTAETYEKITVPFRKHPKSVKRIGLLNKILTYITYCAYLILVVYCLGFERDDFIRILLVPAIGFAFVTIFRKFCNARRPYEVLDIQPLLVRRKKGQSFPSRHTFSIFMIAMALGYVWIPAGILFLILGALLGSIRVIGGVHFPRDVIAGAAVGIGIGILGFYIY